LLLLDLTAKAAAAARPICSTTTPAPAPAPAPGEGTGTGTEAPAPAPAPAPASRRRSPIGKALSGREGRRRALSNQEWVAKLGVKDLDGLAKRSPAIIRKRYAKAASVKVPGENATDEERAAFREAIGAPKEAAGYEVVMPEGAEQYRDRHRDPRSAERGRAQAQRPARRRSRSSPTSSSRRRSRTPRPRSRAPTPRRPRRSRSGVRKAAQHKEEFRRAAQFLELTKADVADIQREFGAGKTLDLFAKIGGMMGEDFFASGNPAQRFGVASLEAAQKPSMRS
jgi:hypothetical protein